ncbi:MAG: RNA-binding protein [Phycisphaeraceae bacterium]|nr:RNA-binding protein [Phycisphaeraceae bacterium]
MRNSLDAREVTVISVYIGNLPYDATEEQVVELFKEFGEVNRAALVKDRETGRPRGFGFVEMPNDDEAHRAIEALSGKDYEGRPLTVNEARNRSAQRNSANLSRSATKEEQTDDTTQGDVDADSPGGYSNDMGKN